MDELQLRSESAHRVVFTHPHRNAWVIIAFVAALWLAAVASDQPRWAELGFGAFCALFILLCLIGAAWRDELELDLAARVYRRRRGWWLAPRSASGGSLDELRAVVLGNRWTTGRGRYLEWMVLLELGGGEPLVVHRGRRETAARDVWSRLARRLGVAAVERAGLSPTGR